MHIDALSGAGNLSGGYQFNNNSTSTLTLGIANGSGVFSGNIADDPNAHLAIIKTGTGTQAFSGQNSYTGGTTVNNGTLILASSSALAPLSDLTLNAGAVVESGQSPITLRLSSLTLAGSGGNWLADYDLTSNKLILQPTANKAAVLATLQAQVAFGRTHINGINSSTLPANYGIAALDNAVTNFTTFGGLPVYPTSLLLAPELLGDANLDGKIDLTDLSTVLNHFGQSTLAWTDGNFDGSQTIDLTDLSAILNNFGQTNPNPSAQLPFTNPQLPPTPTPTPEPTPPALLLPAPLLLRRRSAISSLC
ncbi:MAG: autotransporter-associated beta strand repeat-containing protein [Phycisphaerae bacterium]